MPLDINARGEPRASGALFAGSTLAYDLSYGPAARAFVESAQARGARAVDGLGMLVEQAAESFALWRGKRPRTEPVLAELGARAREAGSAGPRLVRRRGRRCLPLHPAFLSRRVWWMKDHNPRATAFMEDRLDRLRDKKPAAQLRQSGCPMIGSRST
jgi:hypothetical protein